LRSVLTLNAGSSSLKFALFVLAEGPKGRPMPPRLRGEIEGLGAAVHFSAKDAAGTKRLDRHYAAEEAPADAEAALRILLDWLEGEVPGLTLAAIGHRVVHGGIHYAAPLIVDDKILADLKTLEPLAPLHQPFNLDGIAAARAAHPEALQIACFDTAFHRAHPWENDVFALPRALYDEGVRRYGFHGLSYEFITRRMRQIAPEIAGGRLIVAHLGNGASMCAIRDGVSVGSSMGFSALDGLPMGTRCGQIDPGVLLYLMQEHGYDAKRLTTLLYKESGLKGLSGITHDMRTLEASDDPRAAEAIRYFDFRIRREIGAMAAILGGVDGVVFTGGIGENSTRVRAEATAGMDWIGIAVDPARNAGPEMEISPPGAKVRVFKVPTDEEAMIARHVSEVLEARGAAA
jgi:acetate kinase